MAILLPPEDLLPPHSGVDSLLMGLPDGPSGTSMTMRQMVAWTKAYRSDPGIIQLARSIVAGVPGKSYLDEADSILKFVRSAVRYTMDPYDVETLQTPDYTLQAGAGDCDDMALLAGTLLQAVGHPVRYVAFSFDVPGNFAHVYLETKINEVWYGLECTENVPFGWTPFAQNPPPVDWMIRTV